MNTPRLSVGLPVFNGENFIAESIESMLTQDFTDFELVISDNASTDCTEEICRAFVARDPRVKYYRHDANRGGAWNYTQVFRLGTAPVFKWQAHDDYCLPGLFRRGMEAIERAPSDVVLVFCETQLVDVARRPLAAEFIPEMLDLRESHPAARLHHLLRDITMGRPQFGFIRSAALRQTRVIDRFIAADLVMLAELAMLGKFHRLPEPLFQRRIHDAISTRANRDNDARLQWWDTSQRRYRHLLPPMLRLGPEYLRSVARMPLSPADKFACACVAAWTWNARQFRIIAGRWLRRLRGRPTSDTPASDAATAASS